MNPRIIVIPRSKATRNLLACVPCTTLRKSTQSFRAVRGRQSGENESRNLLFTIHL